MVINRLIYLFLVLPLVTFSQTITGRVIDQSTQKPLETVTVYFDNTTIGTTTNANGDFTISFSDAIQSNLVISYLGYETQVITDYRVKTSFTVALKPSAIDLDEIILDFDDGLTRKQKLKLFRKEFLGMSKYALSCKILNESDIILRWDKQSKTLYASSDMPIRIKNKALQYELSFDIIDFEANYSYVNLKTQEFVLDKVTYAGTSYYKDLEKADKKSTKRKREKVYKGSVQHFMRSLYNKTLRDEGYQIFHRGFQVNEWTYFTLKPQEGTSLKEVLLKDKVSILFDKNEQSDIYLNVNSFLVDAYGNYSNIRGIFFNGTMGSQRVGDTLPLDYGLKE